MNFSMAKNMAAAQDIEVDSVVVKDDVAVPDSTYSAGRRGIAGTVLVQKTAGAMAERGASLAEVKRVAEKAIGRVRTMGMSMSACVLPGLEKPGFEVGENEIEIGMGIHGEPGIEKSPVKTSAELAPILLGKLLADYSYAGKRVALMVNGMGGTTLMELYTLAADLGRELAKSDISVGRAFVGNYMTSLEMLGCSVSLLELDDELETLINTPCDTPGLKILP
jgi:dihydroxyacetone kinase-like protein